MPAITRELSIAYAGVTLGGSSSDYLLDGKYEIDHNYDSTTLRARVVCVGSSAANLKTAADALEAAFRTPNGSLTVTLDGNALTSLTHAGGTGMLARPTIRKFGHDLDSGRARVYDVSVTLLRPADLSGKGGLRQATFERVTDPAGLQRVTLTGEYTATSSGSASANFASGLAALITSATSGLSGTFETLDKTVSPDDEDKTASFRVVVQQVGHNQLSGVLDSAYVADHQITVRTTREAPGDTGSDVRRPQRIDVDWSAWVVRAQTTDLDAFYTDTVRPYLIAIAQEAAESGAGFALVRDSGLRERVRNRLSASVSVIAMASATIERRVSTRDEEIDPIDPVPVHDGNPYSRLLMPVAGTIRRTITTTTVVVGAAFSSSGGSVQRTTGSSGVQSPGGLAAGGTLVGPNSGGPGGAFINSGPGLQSPGGLAAGGTFVGPNSGGPGGAFLSAPGGAGGGGGRPGGAAGSFSAGLIRRSRVSDTTPLVVGLPELQLEVTERTVVEVWELAQPPSGAGAGGGGSRGSGSGVSTQARVP